MSGLSGRRFHQLFGGDGRSVVIAIDHGTTDGVFAGLENP
jgi:DhnA family fructose-bisphosphate aldolase class Ia